MPFKALDTDTQKPIYAFWFEESNNLRAKHPNLVCPCCKGRVAARGGQSRRFTTHFYHVAKGGDGCLLGEKSKGVNLIHHTMMVTAVLDYLKPRIPKSFSLDTEHISEYVPGRIADLAVLDYGGKIVEAHEVQLTKVPISELQERTDSYEQAGVEVVWWFGKGCQTDDVIQWAQRNFGYCILPDVSFFSEETEMEGF